MRRLSFHPAVQLHSAAGRYRDAARVHSPAQALPGCVPRSTVGSPEPTAIDQPVGDEDLQARLEAVLFLSREPLSSRKLAQFAGLEDGTQARTMIRRLNERYDQALRSFRVEEMAGGYQLLTRRGYSPWLRRLAHVPGEVRLSAPALETLAVIAYRQPVLKADIEAIRGVNCGEILRQLMERDLVRISGRSQELGRPFLYATTRRFLHLFGLGSIDDLPRADILRDAPLPSGPPLGQLAVEADATAEEEATPSGEEPLAGYTGEDPWGQIESAELDAGNRP